MRRSSTHKGLSVLLNAVLLGTFIAVPMMDGVSVEHDVAIESEHGACDFVSVHDHAICVQFGSNQAHVVPVAEGTPGTPQARRLVLSAGEVEISIEAGRLLPPTRAPPRI